MQDKNEKVFNLSFQKQTFAYLWGVSKGGWGFHKSVSETKKHRKSADSCFLSQILLKVWQAVGMTVEIFSISFLQILRSKTSFWFVILDYSRLWTFRILRALIFMRIEMTAFFKKIGSFSAIYLCLFNTVNSEMCSICQWLDSNRRHLVSEMTALPTEPQPLPIIKACYFITKSLDSIAVGPNSFNLIVQLLYLMFEFVSVLNAFRDNKKLFQKHLKFPDSFSLFSSFQ